MSSPNTRRRPIRWRAFGVLLVLALVASLHGLVRLTAAALVALAAIGLWLCARYLRERPPAWDWATFEAEFHAHVTQLERRQGAPRPPRSKDPNS